MDRYFASTNLTFTIRRFLILTIQNAEYNEGRAGRCLLIRTPQRRQVSGDGGESPRPRAFVKCTARSPFLMAPGSGEKRSRLRDQVTWSLSGTWIRAIGPPTSPEERDTAI